MNSKNLDDHLITLILVNSEEIFFDFYYKSDQICYFRSKS